MLAGTAEPYRRASSHLNRHPSAAPPEKSRGARTRTDSTSGGLQRISEGVGLVRGHLDDQPATTLQRNPHDDAPALLGDLQRTVARPRLHRRHVVSPQLARTGAAPPIRTNVCAPGSRAP